MPDLEKEYLKCIIKQLDGLILYGSIIDDPVIIRIRKICEGNDVLKNFSEVCLLLTEFGEDFKVSGNLLKSYIISLFLHNENRFSLYCENNEEVENTSLYRLAVNDIKILKSLINMKTFFMKRVNSFAFNEICGYVPIHSGKNEIFDYISSVQEEEILKALIDFYKKSGCGDISIYNFFRYDEIKEKIVGIKNPDRVTFDDIIGYEEQTKTLMENTEAFIKGLPANNVLLVGARGTGKSSSVKALANKYYKDGLRLIEITKEQISKLPSLLGLLKKRGRKFILFMDDLSFDEQELRYKGMKSLLEGGSESRPENVLFYATSNRRNLISEKWGDRKRGSDEEEIHTGDTLNEKLSLADRFGVTIFYSKPTPQEYINMVKVMAKRYNINMSEELLEKEAFKWELNQRGVSGRTAKQFINRLRQSDIVNKSENR